MDYSLLIGIRRQLLTIEEISSTNTTTGGGAAIRATFASVPHPASSTQQPLSLLGRPTHTDMATDLEHNEHNEHNPFSRDLDGGMRSRSVEGPGTYFMGIIDILQVCRVTYRLPNLFSFIIISKKCFI